MQNRRRLNVFNLDLAMELIAYSFMLWIYTSLMLVLELTNFIITGTKTIFNYIVINGSNLGTLLLAYFAWKGIEVWRQQTHVQIQLKFLDEINLISQECIQEFENFKLILRDMKISQDISCGNNPSHTIDGIQAFYKDHKNEFSELLLKALVPITPLIKKLNAMSIKGKSLDFNYYSLCTSSIKSIDSIYKQLNRLQRVLTYKEISNPVPQEHKQRVFNLVNLDQNYIDKIFKDLNESSSTLSEFFEKNYKSLLKIKDKPL